MSRQRNFHVKRSLAMTHHQDIIGSDDANIHVRPLTHKALLVQKYALVVPLRLHGCI